MTQKASGKAHRKGITLPGLTHLFPDEDADREWFESIPGPNGPRHCPEYGSLNTHEAAPAKMPVRGRKYFSIKTGTVMARSLLPLLKWVYAIYLDVTSLKGGSSLKLHRDLGITQKTAWFMPQRPRKACTHQGLKGLFSDLAVADETYFGVHCANLSKAKCKALAAVGAGRGTKHLQRYVNEFTGRHNLRAADSIDVLVAIASGRGEKRLQSRPIIADNGLSFDARSA